MFDFKEYVLDVNQLQLEYERLRNSVKISKKDICNLCIPFMDKYGLSDAQTLLIARKQVGLDYILNETGIKLT
ncbi:hypothetical protein [Blautia producta]|uniref:hypothetical protein n=1 Tax=Blautia producta TaxID=33035 RepID=UPI003564561B